MGMDVYGKAPDNEVGGYFRRSVWGWHPLVDIIEAVCHFHGRRDLFDACEYWHTNDGRGLDAARSLELAALLHTALTDGLIDDLIRIRDEALTALPDEPCEFCKGTGVRTDAVGRKHGMPEVIIPEGETLLRGGKTLPHPRAGQTGRCNGCDGVGAVRPWQTRYSVDREDVVEWTEFLVHCNGFEIC